MTTRRGFITGLISFAAAPAIVRAESLMRLPVRRRAVITEFYNNRVIRSYIDIETLRDRNVLLRMQPDQLEAGIIIPIRYIDVSLTSVRP